MPALPLYLSELDRAAERRDDAAWLAHIVATGARVVPVWRDRSLVDATASQALLPHASVLGDFEGWIFLGIGPSGDAYVAAALPPGDDEATSLARLDLREDTARFADLRALRATLPLGDAGLLGYARALVHWNAKTRFCSVCGAATRSASGGHIRDCTNEDDGTRHFPRTDPAVIMLVHDGDRALLGRQQDWPPAMYSALAGFVEPGESLEDTVVREVREESGVSVADVHYFASQPWPYPQSLMLGFFARATSREIIRGDELDDVRWFSREEVRKLGEERALSLPGVDTIARRLIGAWQRGEHEGDR